MVLVVGLLVRLPARLSANRFLLPSMPPATAVQLLVRKPEEGAPSGADGRGTL